ncbi:MAG: hypothetical protein GY798_32480 [Hyphomicrobiales bacterium]|nr:hypothetical protein [Hyphomicrobiales bacterium]
MTIKENDTSSQQSEDRAALILAIYGRGIAIVMMLLGLRHWAVILGLTQSSVGSFEAMTTDWKLATMHLAVVDLVAAVGLWQRVAWGNVVWIYAALAVVAMHTLFIGVFGSDTLIVVFHSVTLAVYLMLYILERRVLAGPGKKKA